jgi:hypothetical protein
LFVCLVQEGGVSLRGASRALQVVFTCLGITGKVPHWTTGRLWLQRLGLARLREVKEQADDWAWLADHSVQIGQHKCLVILGIRLAHLPPVGQCLRLANMKLIALVPMISSTSQSVHEELERAVPQTGVPRVVAKDHGSDLRGGVAFFQEKHPQTVAVYDTKHKCACLLKHRLEKDERWTLFNRQVGKTRSGIQQTELAFLVPPGPRPKARFMNLGALLKWALKVLVVLTAPSAKVLEWVSLGRLREKLGWLEEFRAALEEWGEWQRVIDAAVVWVGRNGLYEGAADDLKKALPQLLQHASSQQLADELTVFVAEQAQRARPGERFPGSTEVEESSFGRFKEFERGQAKGGFTGLLVAFGALLATPTIGLLRSALQATPTKHVRQWCKDNLGTTLASKRKVAFQSAPRPAPAQQKPDEGHQG